MSPYGGSFLQTIMSEPIKRLNLNFEQHELLLKLLEDNLPNDPTSDEFELFYTTFLKLKKAPTYKTAANKKGNSQQYKVK